MRLLFSIGLLAGSVCSLATAQPIHFSRDIRPILSEYCFACHGPDDKKREAGLRLDDETAAKQLRDGVTAVMPGQPEKSGLIQRIESTDPDEVMPPPKLHKPMPMAQIALLKQWIREGAPWGGHWSYESVRKPSVPPHGGSETVVDAFLGHRLASDGLSFADQADAATLIRRLALDLTGLPPTESELDQFLSAAGNGFATGVAYADVVAHYLSKPAFGEHWARMWLDLARYADSSGYPSDQPREIWAYRDWVIRAFNSNMPFDQFTIEQLAGDLLPEATEDQLIATAFHRNTMTQNEGGTSDEEFRNAAVIDRVNTTMAVWMGTSMACAQCHTHKYDPITIKEYFQFYALLNQTADSDKKDESPLLSFYPDPQKGIRKMWTAELAALNAELGKPHARWLAGQQAWEKSLPLPIHWAAIKPKEITISTGQTLATDTSRVHVEPTTMTQTLVAELPLPQGRMEALRIEAEQDSGAAPKSDLEAKLVQVRSEWVPRTLERVRARYVKVERPSVKYDFLALAEVQVFSGSVNVAEKGRASQISTSPGGPEAKLAIDGNTDGDSVKGRSVSITGGGESTQWWQLDLIQQREIDRIVFWKRTDTGPGAAVDRLKLTLLDEQMQPVWEQEIQTNKGRRYELSLSGRRELRFIRAVSDIDEAETVLSQILVEKPSRASGWNLGSRQIKPRSIMLFADNSRPVGSGGAGSLRLELQFERVSLESSGIQFKFLISEDERIRALAGMPANVLRALEVPAEERSVEERALVYDHYVREHASETKQERTRVRELNRLLSESKAVTVPIMRELPEHERRSTRIQLRGNWQDLGEEVPPNTPSSFPPLPQGTAPNRLALAKWLVSRENPLTARVMVNRLWEQIFGVGIVRTSEEFGAQGELPIHPELLDWLAADFMEQKWDIKHVISLLVNSRAYKQSSQISPALLEKDPENRFLARGPRFRPTGEQLRDQALAVSGLLSAKMYGPGVRPMAPSLGLNTAFGRSNDWTTSVGEDRYRRSVYTELRRNAPYASYMTFDATNREVCTLRRNRTNTPLQAFVTLNDPVFVECAQALGRRVLRTQSDKTDAERMNWLFRLCLARQPSESELKRLLALLDDIRQTYRSDSARALQIATIPFGPMTAEMPVHEAASWTTVANVVMNLDEFVMRR